MTYKALRIQLQTQSLAKKMYLLGMNDVQLDSCRAELWEITSRRIQSLSDVESMLTKPRMWVQLLLVVGSMSLP